MKVITFDEQPLEARCFALDGPDIHPETYPGQDSVVFRNDLTGCVIHVYNRDIAFWEVLTYAQCVNTAASSLDAHPFIENIKFEDMPYKACARVNPVKEVGETFFVINGNKSKHAYTVSPFIDGFSLCWPNRASDEEQRAVARSFNMLFYDGINEFIRSQSRIYGVDINPVNVKFAIDRNQRKILLVITDLAKNIKNVTRLNSSLGGG